MPTSIQIARDISRQVGVRADVCENILAAFFARVRDNVLAGERVQIRGFGSFRPRLRKAGERYNPKSKERFQVEEATLIAFSQAKAGKDDADKSPLDGIA